MESDTLICLCVSVILILLGAALALNNWYSIIEWVLTIRKNSCYNRGDACVPLCGGLLLCAGFSILYNAFHPEFPMWSIPLGLMLDYGCLPAFVLQPILYRWSEKKKKSAKHSKKAS